MSGSRNSDLSSTARLYSQNGPFGDFDGVMYALKKAIESSQQQQAARLATEQKLNRAASITKHVSNSVERNNVDEKTSRPAMIRSRM